MIKEGLFDTIWGLFDKLYKGKIITIKINFYVFKIKRK